MQFTGLKYQCSREEGVQCCIPSIASICMENYLLNALECCYDWITTPFTLDSKYVTINTSLKNDIEYFHNLKKYNGTIDYTTSVVHPNVMRLITSQTIKDITLLELCQHRHYVLQGLNYSRGLKEGLFQFNDMYHYLFHHYVNKAIQADKQQWVCIMRKYLSLSPDIVGSSVGIPTNNAILATIEQFLLLRIIVIDADSNSYVTKEDPIYHVGGLELLQLFCTGVAYYPLHLLILHKCDDHYSLMKPINFDSFSVFPPKIKGML
eukprot:15367008-Ditylum_brightwellii.AAC.1